MHIGVLGINDKSAGIHVREHVSKACQWMISQENQILEKYHCMILSTCNRTEIYFSADDLADAHSGILNILREEIDIAFEHKLYSYFGFDCFMQLARVTSGLDSVIIGESEIQRQVKAAYEQTLLNDNLPSCMHFLVQKSLKLGKQIRSNFFFSPNQVSIEKTLFQISQNIFKDFSDEPILFIGNSEINRKIIAYFKRQGIQNITLCTRGLLSAKKMFEKEELTLLPWEKLSLWQMYPLVVCGSNVPHCIIDHPHDHLKTRLIFDLSVPRNVDPSLFRHPQLILLNIEEVNEVIEKKQEKNLLEIERAEVLILENVQRYYQAFHQKDKKVYAFSRYTARD